MKQNFELRPHTDWVASSSFAIVHNKDTQLRKLMSILCEGWKIFKKPDKQIFPFSSKREDKQMKWDFLFSKITNCSRKSQVFNLSSFAHSTKCDKNEINWDGDKQKEIYWFSHSITKGQTESINQQKPGHPTGRDEDQKFLFKNFSVHCPPEETFRIIIFCHKLKKRSIFHLTRKCNSNLRSIVSARAMKSFKFWLRHNTRETSPWPFIS